MCPARLVHTSQATADQALRIRDNVVWFVYFSSLAATSSCLVAGLSKSKRLPASLLNVHIAPSEPGPRETEVARVSAEPGPEAPVARAQPGFARCPTIQTNDSCIRQACMRQKHPTNHAPTGLACAGLVHRGAAFLQGLPIVVDTDSTNARHHHPYILVPKRAT
jgi:hypothetical protein